MECPNIERSVTPDPRFNKPLNYRDYGGNADYIFYDHHDDDTITRVQFCKKLGRKRDVFECLNESEWRNCRAYKEDTDEK